MKILEDRLDKLVAKYDNDILDAGQLAYQSTKLQEQAEDKARTIFKTAILELFKEKDAEIKHLLEVTEEQNDTIIKLHAELQSEIDRLKSCVPRKKGQIYHYKKDYVEGNEWNACINEIKKRMGI